MSYTGVVISYGGQKGYGFINCEGIPGDIFFGRNALQGELKEAAGDFFPLKGKTVQFELKEQEAADAKPQATMVKLQVAEGEALLGQVKSFNPSKGFGFLSSTAMEGQDFFFSKRDLPPQFHTSPLQGAIASFVVAQTPEGKLQAKNLNIRGAGIPMGLPIQGMPMQAMPQMQSMIVGGGQPQVIMHPSGMMMLAAPQMGMKGVAAATGGASAGGAGGFRDGQRLQGVVHSYNPEKGFGFVKCPKVPADLYFKGQGAEYQQGTAVAFTLKVMPDGKLQAREVSQGITDGIYTATVTSYSSRNGYGFFTVPGGLGDVYFKKQLVPLQLQESELRGMHARIVVQMTQDGKPQASKAQFLEHAPPGYVAPPPKGSGGNAGAAMGGGVAAFGGGVVGSSLAMGGVKRPAGAMALGMPSGNQMQILPAQLAQQQAAKRMRADQAAASPGMGMGGQATGVIKSYNPTKGFGFIQSPVSAKDIFFGKSSMPAFLAQQSLQGRPCSFELVFAPDGKPQAQNLQVA